MQLRRGATFDPSGAYRYLLTRQWGGGGRRIAFVMLNPSTADARRDDPTIRRCIGFARSWGFDRLDVVNIFAHRATRPADLARAHDPVGPDNNRWIRRAARRADLIVAAWGNHACLHDRHRHAWQLLRPCTERIRILGATRSGQPRHPLYVHAGTRPVAPSSDIIPAMARHDATSQDREAMRSLMAIPNVGPATAGDLIRLGVRSTADLRRRSPQRLYDELCRLDGQRLDPCVLDVFTAVVAYVREGDDRPWWAFSRERLARAGKSGRPRR